MTRDEILNMPAGREMDILVSQKVLDLMQWIPFISSDIGEAWEVVNNLSDKWDCKITTGNMFPGYQEQKFGCKFDNKNEPKVVFALAETAPLAICRAALLAAMKD